VSRRLEEVDMSFEPPFCPHPDCSNHFGRPGRFYRRRGSYKPRCRRFRISRMQCRACRRTFSRQTFRVDYRDRHPQTNVRILEMLCSGTGLRQVARTVGLDPRAVQQKLRKYGAHAARLHDNLARRLPSGREFVFDEEESYEHKSIWPVTVPILIDAETWFVVACAVGPIRRLAPAGTARRRWQDEDEKIHGRRPDESRRRVREVLTDLRRRVPVGQLQIRSDEKASYRRLVPDIFGDRAVHRTTSGRSPRTKYNRLFPINVTIAMSRDNCGRLRRRSWLVSKRAARLRDQLALFMIYRNYIRRRFNRDEPEHSPAQMLGLLPRALRWSEALRWRQDWGARSIHPLSTRARNTVGEVLASAA